MDALNPELQMSKDIQESFRVLLITVLALLPGGYYWVNRLLFGRTTFLLKCVETFLEIAHSSS